MTTGTSSVQLSQLQRLEWPDIAKGITMILVVTGHVLGGLMAGHFVAEAPWGRWIYDWIYLFHVPTLFFVSGWLVEFRTRVKGAGRMRDFVVALLYPYFLWGIIIWIVHLAGSGSGIANVQVDLWAPLRMFYAASSGPWFLYVLFLLHGLNLSLQGQKYRVGCLMAFSLAAFADYASWSFVEFDSTRCRFELNAIFYASGVWLASNKGALLETMGGNKMAFLAGSVLLALLGWMCWHHHALSPWSRLPLGIAGIAGVLGLSLGLTTISGTKWLGWLGRQSLAIYVLHGFAPPVTRWLLTSQWGVTNPVVLILTGVIAGLLSAAGFAWMVRRWHISWVFGFGRRLESGVR